MDRILHRAKSQAKKIERDSQNRAKDFETRARRNVESEIRKQKQKLQNAESQLQDKESRMDREAKRKESEFQEQMQELNEQKNRIEITEKRLADLESKALEQLDEVKRKLESSAGYTEEQAKKELFQLLEEKAKSEAAERMDQIESELKQESKKKARRVLSMAIARYASEVVTERTVITIPLVGEEVKGKIIGREGRNIRALEAACGVDVVVDETPDSVIISSFDPIRREVGREAIRRLIEDGRVHPARIEEVVDKVKQDLIAELKEEEKKACFDLGVHGVHPEILGLIGSLKYRHTGTQNLLAHSTEVAFMAGLMAAELGFDVKLARRAGLLHDIGRAIDHTVEGDHASAGADFAKKHGETDEVCKAIRYHEEEEDLPDNNWLIQITQAANNLSKNRPGARRSMMENFIRRLEDLESIGNSFDGVERTYAIQSGKEIRVIVDSSKVTDEQSNMLSRDIAKKIERELSYPGQIKVSVVRETRIVEHAR